MYLPYTLPILFYDVNVNTYTLIPSLISLERPQYNNMYSVSSSKSTEYIPTGRVGTPNPITQPAKNAVFNVTLRTGVPI